MGTSLKVAGIRTMVKTVSKMVKEAHGVVVLVNDRYLGKEWDGVFTHWIKGRCDEICMHLKSGIQFLETKGGKTTTPKKVLAESKETLKISSLLKTSKVLQVKPCESKFAKPKESKPKDAKSKDAKTKDKIALPTQTLASGKENVALNDRRLQLGRATRSQKALLEGNTLNRRAWAI